MQAYRYLWWILCAALLLGGSLVVSAEPSADASVANNTADGDNAALTLKTLAVNHLNAKRLAEQLTPFVPAPGTIAVVNQRLVINSSAHNIAEIESLLQQLDTPPEELTLSVRFNAPQASPIANTDTNSHHYQTRAIDHTARKVRTQAHQPTRIAQSHIQEDLTPSGWGGFNTQHRKSEGYELYATIELNGETATLALATRHYQGSKTDQDLYDIETRISGPVGQWLALTPGELKNTPSGTKRYQLPPSGDTMYIKVERVSDTVTTQK